MRTTLTFALMGLVTITCLPPVQAQTKKKATALKPTVKQAAKALLLDAIADNAGESHPLLLVDTQKEL